MMKHAFLLFILVPIFSFGQWITTDLATMPVRVSNNAVVANSDGSAVYSFSGIDSTKLYSGIHLKSYKYDVGADSWSQIPDLPDTLGKIAASASLVKDKVYIIGGYHVLANQSEISSNKVHVYNTMTDSYEVDAMDIPVHIDDQVQVVWRDSLIFVVTGWSTSGNVTNVQIFNPSLNTWEVGTDIPNHIDYKCFGATGKIIGDTIYYYGGVSGSFSFNARNYLRKGVIDPDNPTQITWTKETDAPEVAGYRCASAVYQDQFFVIGGAGTGYNYDGIAYNGSGGVSPAGRILKYDANLDNYNIYQFLPEVMDHRGEGKLSSSSWLTCGGMESGQNVTNRVVRYDLDENQLLGVETEVLEKDSFRIVDRILFLEEVEQIVIQDVSGRVLYSESTQSLDLGYFEDHILLITLIKENDVFTKRIVNL